MEMIDTYGVSPEDRDNNTDSVRSSRVSEPEDLAAEVELGLIIDLLRAKMAALPKQMDRLTEIYMRLE